ncbi:MAG: ammonium transporter, partial [Proteobacteria bacterium]
MRSKFIPMVLLLFVAVFAAVTQTGEAVKPGGPINSGDVAWMLSATALVLFMTPCLAFFYGGMVRAKNVISTMLQSFVSMGLISLLWVVVAFSLAFGDSIGGVIGDPRTFFMFKGVTGATHTELSPTIP